MRRTREARPRLSLALVACALAGARPARVPRRAPNAFGWRLFAARPPPPPRSPPPAPRRFLARVRRGVRRGRRLHAALVARPLRGDDPVRGGRGRRERRASPPVPARHRRRVRPRPSPRAHPPRRPAARLVRRVGRRRTERRAPPRRRLERAPPRAPVPLPRRPRRRRSKRRRGVSLRRRHARRRRLLAPGNRRARVRARAQARAGSRRLPGSTRARRFRERFFERRRVRRARAEKVAGARARRRVSKGGFRQQTSFRRGRLRDEAPLIILFRRVFALFLARVLLGRVLERGRFARGVPSRDDGGDHARRESTPRRGRDEDGGDGRGDGGGLRPDFADPFEVFRVAPLPLLPASFAPPLLRLRRLHRAHPRERPRSRRFVRRRPRSAPRRQRPRRERRPDPFRVRWRLLPARQPRPDRSVRLQLRPGALGGYRRVPPRRATGRRRDPGGVRGVAEFGVRAASRARRRAPLQRRRFLHLRAQRSRRDRVRRGHGRPRDVERRRRPREPVGRAQHVHLRGARGVR